jgi:phosphoglycerol transferase MdoB-like AlkP superfamily enzyme
MITSFLTFLLIAFGFISAIKMDKRSDPIVPQDIYLLKESWNMASKYITSLQITFFVAGVILFAITIILIGRYKWNSSTPLKIRITISLFSLLSLIVLSNIKDDNFWNMLGVTNKITRPSQNLQVNGFVMGNFLQLTMGFQQKPEGYTKGKTEALISTLEEESKFTSNKELIQPNLIFIQLEAFFDPTTLPNVTFSEDPIPYFRSLQERYTSGNLGVNVFGAGTANTEFEVLTGMSLQLFPYDTHPFTSHVNKPMDSVAQQLKKYGYTTSGMHNNVGWFYKREDVYPRLGIDHLLFSDDIKSNESVYDVPAVPKDYELFEEINQRTSKTKEKDYVLGVTMELHGPYYLWYGHDIKVNSNVLPQEHIDIVEEYAYKINEVDKALKRLIDFYEKQEEPTMIVMYSDHLPWLGDDKIIYYETGYADKSESVENLNKMYNTPLLIWDNYRNKERENITLGSSFLVPYVFKEIGLNGNALTLYLQKKMDEGIFRLPPPAFQESTGWTPESINEYRSLQYYYLSEPPE